MSAAPQPALLWSFENSLREIITGALPNSTIGTSITYTTGKYGQGFNMIPTTSNGFIYYTSDNIPWIPLFPYAQGLTTSVWINYTVPGTAGWIMDLSSYNGGAVFRDRIRITISSTPAINLNIGATTGGFSYNVPGSGQTGVWYHYAFVINISSGLIISYLNGVQTNSTAVPSSWASDIQYYGGNIGVGCRVNGSDPATTATIDDLRIYNTALSAAQIYGIYQSQGIPPTITMVPSTGGAPSPQNAWPFQNSVIDAVQGVYPASANVGGVNWNTWLSGNTWPYYDSTAPVYGSNSIILNSINSAYSNGISYTINSPFGGSSSFAVCFWIKPIQTILNAYGYYLRVQSTAGNFNLWLNSSYNPNYSANGSLGFIINGFPSSTAPLNKWTHIAVSIVNTSSNITSQFFTNGVGGVVSTGLPLLPQSNVFTVLNVGFNNGGAGEWELGAEFGDLRIFNTALTPTQIQTIYRSGGNLYGATSVQPSLLWSFNGSNVDSVTNLSPISRVNATSPLVYTTGIYGQSIFINNTPGQAAPQQALNYNVASYGLSVFTMSIWILPLAWPNANRQSFLFFDNGTAYFVFGFDTPALLYNSTGVNIINIQLTQQKWTHITISVNSGTLTLYINGVQFGTSAVTGTFTPSTPLTYIAIGNQFSGAKPAYMQAQDLRIYNTALTDAQIYGIYQSQGIPPRITMVPTSGNLPSPYLAWPFQGSTIDVIQNKDTSSSNVNGAYNATTNPNQLYPYYDTLTQLTGTSSLRIFNSNTAPAVSNTITYTLSGLPVDTTGSAVTISLWFKWITYFNYNFTDNFILNFPAGSVSFNTNGGDLFIEGGGIPGTTFGRARCYGFGVSIPEKWYHVTLVFTAAQVLVYGNGAFVGNGVGSFSPPLTVQGGTSNIITSLTLGTAFTPTRYSSVEFGDLRIYNSALTSTQIQTIYNSGGNLYGANLVQPTYMWPFQNSTIDVIQGKDFGTSNVSGTLNVRPYTFYDTTGQKAGNSSIVFNNPTGFASNALIYNVSFPIYQSNACTYSFWFKWITFSGALFKVYTSTGGGMGTIQTSGNNLQMVFGTISGSTITLSGSFSNFNISSLGVWYHVAVVATSSGQTVYGNGNLLGTYIYSPPLNIQSTANTIGAINLSCVNGLGSNPTLATSNEIADLRFYNTALSTSQIQTIYQSGGASPMVNIT
jgi:hypothetical protein